MVDARSRMNLGLTIRAGRLGIGLTLDQLAARASTTASTLSRVERGERVPSADLLDRLTSAIADEASQRRRAS